MSVIVGFLSAPVWSQSSSIHGMLLLKDALTGTLVLSSCVCKLVNPESQGHLEVLIEGNWKLAWKLKGSLRLCNSFPFLSGLILKIMKLKPREFREWPKVTANSLMADPGQKWVSSLSVHPMSFPFYLQYWLGLGVAVSNRHPKNSDLTPWCKINQNMLWQLYSIRDQDSILLLCHVCLPSQIYIMAQDGSWSSDFYIQQLEEGGCSYLGDFLEVLHNISVCPLARI